MPLVLVQGTAKQENHAETARKDLLDEEEQAKKQLAAIAPSAEPDASVGAELDADIADQQGGTDSEPSSLLLPDTHSPKGKLAVMIGFVPLRHCSSNKLL